MVMSSRRNSRTSPTVFRASSALWYLASTCIATPGSASNTSRSVGSACGPSAAHSSSPASYTSVDGAVKCSGIRRAVRGSSRKRVAGMLRAMPQFRWRDASWATTTSPSDVRHTSSSSMSTNPVASPRRNVSIVFSGPIMLPPRWAMRRVSCGHGRLRRVQGSGGALRSTALRMQYATMTAAVTISATCQSARSLMAKAQRRAKGTAY